MCVGSSLFCPGSDGDLFSFPPPPSFLRTMFYTPDPTEEERELRICPSTTEIALLAFSRHCAHHHVPHVFLIPHEKFDGTKVATSSCNKNVHMNSIW